MAKKRISMFLLIMFLFTLAMTPGTRRHDARGPVAGMAAPDGDPEPGFQEVEREKEIHRQGGKFPWLLVGGVVAGAAIGALLVFTVFKKKDHDIRGTWEMDLYMMGEPLRTLRLYFAGSKTAGDYSGGSYGLYSVAGEKVQFGYGTHGAAWSFNGKFDGSGRMSGTYSWASWWSPTGTGTWWARKISSAKELPGQ
jgi:hypothetical protein